MFIPWSGFFDAERCLHQINDLLESRFDLRIRFDGEQHARELFDLYNAKRAALISEHGETRALQSPDYAKAVLISEAARVYLYEIAPKRRKRKSKGQP